MEQGWEWAGRGGTTCCASGCKQLRRKAQQTTGGGRAAVDWLTHFLQLRQRAPSGPSTLLRKTHGQLCCCRSILYFKWVAGVQWCACSRCQEGGLLLQPGKRESIELESAAPAGTPWPRDACSCRMLHTQVGEVDQSTRVSPSIWLPPNTWSQTPKWALVPHVFVVLWNEWYGDGWQGVNAWDRREGDRQWAFTRTKRARC